MPTNILTLLEMNRNSWQLRGKLSNTPLFKMQQRFAHIFKDLSSAVCCLNECLVVVEGQLLSGIED